MKRFLQFYKSQDKTILWSVNLSVVGALTVLITWLIGLPFLPPQLPLYYSMPWGEQQLASKGAFILLPAIIILITLINLLISWHLHPSQIIVKRILNLASAFISLLFFLTAIKIILIFI